MTTLETINFFSHWIRYIKEPFESKYCDCQLQGGIWAGMHLRVGLCLSPFAGLAHQHCKHHLQPHVLYHHHHNRNHHHYHHHLFLSSAPCGMGEIKSFETACCWHCVPCRYSKSEVQMESVIVIVMVLVRAIVIVIVKVIPSACCWHCVPCR